MQTIALVNQKGGAGKSTLAVHLAVAFRRAGRKVVLLDLDPQRSAVDWSSRREDEAPAVKAISADMLDPMMDELAADGVDVLILDTAARLEDAARKAARYADLVLVPCQPSIVDMRAMATTADLLQALRTPAVAVLNGVAAFGAESDEVAAAVVADVGLEVCPMRLGRRVAFARCMITGQTAQETEPDGKAAAEVEALLAWVVERLPKKAQTRVKV